MPKPTGNPEKIMLLMFPVITLAFFILGVLIYYLVPRLASLF